MNCRAIFRLMCITLFTAALGCGDTDTKGGDDVIVVDPWDAGSQSSRDDMGGMEAADVGGSEESDADDGEADTGGNDDNDMGDEDASEDPCGNGILDPGEECDGDCPTSCDDGDACTTDTLNGDPNACTATCEYEADAACDAYAGSYSGSYYIKAEEKVGSSVINSVTCTGTFDLTVDPSRDEHVDGTATCMYSGGLSAFDSNQSATITGGLSPNGSVSLDINHDFGTENDGDFDVDGTISSGSLTVDDTESFYPNSQSAVAWDVVVRLGLD